MKSIDVEVIYPLPKEQITFRATVVEGATAQQAIVQSGILNIYPEIDLKKNKIGIFSRAVRLEEVIKSGDRIEIYRPLIADPKEMRRARAEKAKEEGRINKTTGAKVKSDN